MTTKTAKTRQLADGSIEALSSNGRTVYHVTIGAVQTCDCPAGRNGRRCYHVLTAISRYPALYPAPWANRRASISDLYA